MPGTITFRPVEANLTHDTDWLGKMDPYCVFTVGTQKVRSQVCRHGGKRPHWEDAVTLQTEGNPGICRVEVMDKDRFRPDDSIAATEINLNEIQSLGTVSRWYPVYHRKKLAGEILIETAFQPTGQMIQQPLLVQNVVPVQTTFVEERFMTSAPITEVGQTIPVETFVGQPTNLTSGTFIQGTELSGFNQLPLNQGFSQIPQGGLIQGSELGGFNQLPLNQGFNQLPQGGNLGYYNQDTLANSTGLQNLNAGGINNTGILSSKTSAFGPQGGLPHGHHLLKGTTNAGYSERPGYTLGDVESNPTTQANLDTNGGGFFNKPGRERRAEPYALSNPGTYGIPHGQTIDTAGHLHPEVGLNKQAPIGMINQPGLTGYPDGFNNTLGGAAPQNLGQGNLGGYGSTGL